MEPVSSQQPEISVLIPVRNGAGYLDRCLRSLFESSYPHFECIVVDDSSSDDSAAVAERHGCRVLRLTRNVGPAEARNIAAREAAGEILYFIDSDVCVRSDTLARIAGTFSEQPRLDALIGSYDDDPAHPGFLSQYKNLFHHYTHQSGSESATTFWSGCGAIRRSVLLSYGGFNSDYQRPATEDIELGYRLRSAGRTIRLDKQLLVKHLKVWSFWSMVKTDVLDRGIPWMELILRHHSMPADLNLRVSQRVSVVLIYLAIFVLGAAAFSLGAALLIPLLLTLSILVSNYLLYDAGREGRGWRLAGAAAVAGAAALLADTVGMRHLLAPFLGAQALLLVSHRFLPPRSQRGWSKFLSAGRGACMGVAVLALFRGLFVHPLAVLAGLLFVALLLVNLPLYRFFSRVRGLWFATTVIPFHWIYHFYNGVSFAAGLLLHLIAKIAPREQTPRQPTHTPESADLRFAPRDVER